jgi:hypothetical protein
MLFDAAIAASALLAPSPTIAVQWEAPAVCPSADEVRAMVEQLSSADVVEAREATVTAQAVIREQDGRFLATLTVDSPEGRQRRELDADDCALLGRATAVVVSVALDPVAVAANMPEPEPEPTPAPEPEPPASKPEARPEPTSWPVVVSPPPPVRPRWPFEYGLRAAFGVGGLILPAVGVGFALAPYVGLPFLHVRVSGQYWPPRTRTIDGVRDATAAIQLAAAGVRVCPILRTGRWRFPLCIGSDVGAVIGRARGDLVDSRGPVSSAWGAFILQPGVEVSITPRFGVWAAFEGAISYNRPTFHLDNVGAVYQAGRFGPRALLGIAMHNRRTISR